MIFLRFHISLVPNLLFGDDKIFVNLAVCILKCSLSKRIWLLQTVFLNHIIIALSAKRNIFRILKSRTQYRFAAEEKKKLYPEFISVNSYQLN